MLPSNRLISRFMLCLNELDLICRKPASEVSKLIKKINNLNKTLKIVFIFNV